MVSNTGLIYAMLSAVLWAAYGLLARGLSVRSDSPLAFSVLYMFFGALFSLPFLVIAPGEFQGITKTVLAATFIMTVLYGIVDATQFFARKYLEASRMTVLFQLTPLITFAASLLLLNESVTPGKLAGVGFIMGGNLVAVYKHGGNVTPRGLAWALTAAIALGLVYIADKVAFSHYPLGFYMTISYLVPALYILFFVRDRLTSLRNEWQLASWRIPILSLLSVLGYYFFLKAFSLTEASVVVPVAFTSTILIALGGIILLHERSSIIQKLIGAVFVFIGVNLLR